MSQGSGLKDQAMLDAIHRPIEAYCEQNCQYVFDPNNPSVKLHEPSFGAQEINDAVDVLLSSYVTSGKKVRLFEKTYADYQETDDAVLSNSGSSANLLAVSALCNPLFENHLQAGDEVIVPALSWSTTVWPLVQNNVLPVFVDCDLATLNMDPVEIEKAITPKTRAIMLVHVYGNPCDMGAILAIAKKHSLFVIEDSCEAMGARYQDKLVGSLGDMGTFSLYFSHHISALEGGLTVSNNHALLEIMRMQRAHGWSRDTKEHAKYAEQYSDIDPRFIFLTHGYNLRATELQAAMGQRQLSKLDDFVKVRQNNAEYLQSKLSKFDDIFEFQKVLPGCESSWFGFIFKLQDDAPFDVFSITQYLQGQKIETRPVIAGDLTKHPAMSHVAHRKQGGLPNANKVMKRAFAVGCHHAMDSAACDYIVEAVTQFLGEQAEKVSASVEVEV